MHVCRCVFIVVLGATAALAQDQPSNIHQSTAPPPAARFEIIQSQLAARWTFRLDRFTGRVAQLVKTDDDDSTWQEMQVVGRPAIATPTRPRFQLFTSGLAARFTLLLDTDTGDTWQVVASKRKGADGEEHEVQVWQPLLK